MNSAESVSSPNYNMVLFLTLQGIFLPILGEKKNTLMCCVRLLGIDSVLKETSLL